MEITFCRAVSGELLGTACVCPGKTVGHLQQVAAALVGGRNTTTRLVLGFKLLSSCLTMKEAGLFDGAAVDVVCSPSLVVSGSSDNVARVWDCEEGSCIATFAGHRDEVVSVATSIDGCYVATGSADTTARIWCTSSGECMAQLDGHRGMVCSVAFSPCASALATASDDHTAAIWCIASAKTLAVLRGHDAQVTGVAWSPRGCSLATSSRDHSAKIWCVASGECQMTRHEQRSVMSAAFSPDGRCVVSALSSVKRANKAVANVWLADSGEQCLSLDGHSGTVFSAAFSPDGSHILTASRDCTAKVWCAKDGKCLFTLAAGDDAVLWAAFSATAHCIVTASRDSHAKLWSAEKGEWVLTLQHVDYVNSVAFI